MSSVLKCLNNTPHGPHRIDKGPFGMVECNGIPWPAIDARLERVAEWLYRWDRLHPDATPWAELPDASRTAFHDGARDLLRLVGDGSYAASVEGPLAAVLAELATVKTELRQAERYRHRLLCELRDATAERDAALAVAVEGATEPATLLAPGVDPTTNVAPSTSGGRHG